MYSPRTIFFHVFSYFFLAHISIVAIFYSLKPSEISAQSQERTEAGVDYCPAIEEPSACIATEPFFVETGEVVTEELVPEEPVIVEPILQKQSPSNEPKRVAPRKDLPYYGGHYPLKKGEKPNSIRLSPSQVKKPFSAKLVDNRYVCAKKNDKPKMSNKNPNGHIDMQCCLDPDEVPNPYCDYRG